MRETIESIVIAFVLAFLFRTFEVEAFVIPTSARWLLRCIGRHLVARHAWSANTGFRVGAKRKSKMNRLTLGPMDAISIVTTCTCPNCGLHARLHPALPLRRLISVDRERLLSSPTKRWQAAFDTMFRSIWP